MFQQVRALTIPSSTTQHSTSQHSTAQRRADRQTDRHTVTQERECIHDLENDRARKTEGLLFFRSAGHGVGQVLGVQLEVVNVGQLGGEALEVVIESQLIGDFCSQLHGDEGKTAG